MKISGINKVIEVLKAKAKDAQKASQAEVIVGFTQRYALPVHERLDTRHAPGKTAKYLEGPARRMAKELGGIAMAIYKKTRDLEKGLLVAGLRLQREAQQIVPLDTSALRASAYTARASEHSLKSTEAFAASEQIRLNALKNRKIRAGKKLMKRRKRNK